jgi:hypothetical protein
MRIICAASDVDLWAVRPFTYLMQKYWGDAEVLIGGYTPPGFPLPDGYEFASIGRFSDYPVHRWSDGILRFLEHIPDDLVLWMMPDFWLVRQADVRTVHALGTYMYAHPEVARIDLTADRLYAANAGDVGAYRHIDLIACHLPVPYHLSFQAGIWRRTELMRYLVPGETPWESEMNGSTRMNEAGAIVLGTRQWPVRYLIAVQHGKLTLDGGYQQPCPVLSDADMEAIREWLPVEMLP